jgi:hypothetical protein
MTETTTEAPKTNRRRKCRRCGAELPKQKHKNEKPVFCNEVCKRREKRARWRRNRTRNWRAAARETCPTPQLKVWFNERAAGKWAEEHDRVLAECPERGGDRPHWHTVIAP